MITASEFYKWLLIFGVQTGGGGGGPFLPTAGGTMSGNIAMGAHGITGLANPVNPQDAATKNYVDTIATGGAQAVLAASTANLTATYNNGSSGVGATLTNSGAQAAFSIDGQAGTVSGRYLIKDQSSSQQNGIYILTTLGTGSSNWVLTRATDYDTVTNINDTGLIPVINGTANAGTGWYNTTLMVTVGTTAITFVKFTGISIPVPIANGGTGATSVTVTPTATAWAGWNANRNFLANNFLSGYRTTATAAGTTALTVGDAYQQYFTGTTTQTVVAPDVTTLTLGQGYEIVNNSSGNVTLQSQDASTIQVMAANTALWLTCISISDNSDTGWNAEYFNPATSGATATQVQQSAFNVGVDSGTADDYQIALTPTVSALTDGLLVAFTPLNTNATDSPTISIDAIPGIPVYLSNLEPPQANDFNSSVLAYAIYSQALGGFILLNPAASYVTPLDIQTQKFTFAIDMGSTNAIVLGFTPPIQSNANFLAAFQCSNNNTAAVTLDCGFGALPLVTSAGSALTGGELLSGQAYLALFCTAANSYVLINSSLSGGGGGVTPIQVQQSTFNYAADTGSTNAYVVAMTPTVVTLTNGLPIWVSIASGHGNDNSSTLEVDGTGPQIIIDLTGNTLVGGELLAGNDALFVWNASSGAWVLQNSARTPWATPQQVQQNTFNFAVDTGGAPNVYVVAMDPPVISLQDGLPIWVKIGNTSANTGDSTLEVDGTGAQPIYDLQTNTLVGGEILNSYDSLFVWNATYDAWILQNSASGISGGASVTQVQQNAFNYATDLTNTNNYVVSLTPPVGSLTDGLTIYVNLLHGNTGATDITVDGLGPVTIYTPSNQACTGGEIAGAYTVVELCYSANTNIFNIVNQANLITAPPIQKQTFTYAADGGTANAYIVDYTPAIPVTPSPGTKISFLSQDDNTGASTVTVNGTTNPIVYNDAAGSSLIGGAILNGVYYELEYNAVGHWVILNPSNSPSFTTPKQVQNNQFNYGLDIGAADAYIVAYTPILNTGYTDGMVLGFNVANGNTNTGASTLDAGGGALNIVYDDGFGTTALLPNTLLGQAYYQVKYDSYLNVWVLLNPSVPYYSSIWASQIVDANSNIQLIFTSTPSAENYIGITNNASGSAPGLSSNGLVDSSVPLLFGAKNSFIYFIDNTSTIGAETRWYNAAITEYTGFKKGDTASSSVTFELPDSDGSPDFIMKTNGFSVLSLDNGSQVAGTATNDDATAGNIGEYISSTVLIGAAVSLTSTVSADITTISLSEGDWDINAVVITNPGALTATSQYQAWIGTVSATQPTNPNGGGSTGSGAALGASSGVFMNMGPMRISLASPATIYLSTAVTFATSTMSAYGFIGARRAR